MTHKKEPGYLASFPRRVGGLGTRLLGTRLLGTKLEETQRHDVSTALHNILEHKNKWNSRYTNGPRTKSKERSE